MTNILSKQVIENRIKQVIISVIDNQDVEILGNSALVADLELDSVDFASLVMALEDEFGGVISEEAIAEVVTVSDIVELIQEAQKNS